MATVMGIAARKKGYAIEGLRIHVRKVMTASPPRRIARLEAELSLPATLGVALTAEARGELEHIANTCPVRLSLLDAIEVPVEFDWEAK
jgi:uncharacterized OsmC-like protein